nr:hypothetical protein Iba_chr12cCG8350 [Ipomoea batatas]
MGAMEIVDLLPPVATTGLHLKGFRSRYITVEVVLANSPPPPYTATFSNSFTSTSPPNGEELQPYRDSRSS